MNRALLSLLALAACHAPDPGKDDTDVDDTDPQDTVVGDTDPSTDTDVTADTDQPGDTDVAADTDDPGVLGMPKRVVIRGTWNADLDQPMEGSDYAVSDVGWNMSTDTERELYVSRGTKVAAMGPHSTTSHQCASVAMAYDPISGNDPGYSDLAPDNWLCFQTSSGRIMSAHIVSVETDFNHRLTLDLYEDPPLAEPTSTEIVLPMGDAIDVDAGGLALVQADGDVSLQGTGAGELWPLNGTQLRLMGAFAFDVSECATQQLSTSTVSLTDVPDGTQLCARSSDGHYGILKLVGSDGGTGKVTQWIARP